jgi:hypothetical protein
MRSISRRFRFIGVVVASAAAIGLALWTANSAGKERQRRTAELVRKLTLAYENKDPRACVDLFCWAGVPQGQKEQELKMAERYAQRPLSVSFRSLPWYLPGFLYTRLVEYTDKRDGLRYRPNLTVIGSLDIVQRMDRNPGGKVTVVYYVGERDGRCYLAKAIPAHGDRQN